MFKLIKRIIKIVSLIIFLTPFILLAIMYKGYSAPVEDFENNESLSFTSIANQQFDAFLSDPNADNFEFTLTSEEANAALKAIYAEGNPNFGKTDENIPISQRKYAILIGENNGGFKGVTLDFSEKGLTLEAGIEVGFSNIYYQTTLFLDLEVSIEQVTVGQTVENQYKLVIKNISFGNLPILWMYDFANWTVGLFSQQDLNDLINTAVSGFGNYDLTTKSIWVTTTDLKGLLASNGESQPMLDALLGFIDEENLLLSGFGDNQGGLSLALGQMRSTKTAYQTSSTIMNENDLNALFQGQLTSLLISSLNGDTNLYYDMHEDAFNQLLEYYIGDSMDMNQSFELGDQVYLLETEPLYARYVGNKVHFTIIMKLYNANQPANFFKTDFTLIATPSISEDKKDLIFTIDSIGIGDDIGLSNDKVLMILALVGENEMIVGNQIILEDFMNEFASQGVTVNDVYVHNQYLRFEITPSASNLAILTDLQNQINGALGTVLADPDYADVLDVYNDFLLGNSEPDDLLDAINGLSVEEQADLYDALFQSLNGVTGLEGLLP